MVHPQWAGVHPQWAGSSSSVGGGVHPQWAGSSSSVGGEFILSGRGSSSSVGSSSVGGSSSWNCMMSCPKSIILLFNLNKILIRFFHLKLSSID